MKYVTQGQLPELKCFLINVQRFFSFIERISMLTNFLNHCIFLYNVFWPYPLPSTFSLDFFQDLQLHTLFLVSFLFLFFFYKPQTSQQQLQWGWNKTVRKVFAQAEMEVSDWIYVAAKGEGAEGGMSLSVAAVLWGKDCESLYSPNHSQWGFL